jgi:NADPH:quinone reductase-like Zn-dependent oxidoreductase
MRTVQNARFGGPEVLEVVVILKPEPSPGQRLHDVSTAGVNQTDTNHLVSRFGHDGGVITRDPNEKALGQHVNPSARLGVASRR